MSTMPNDTEKAILTAAEQEFMLKGYGGARTTVIAQKAGVTHAMLHYYYRTKESLFDRIVGEKAAELLNQVIVMFADKRDTPFVEKICHAVGMHFDMLVKNPLLPGFVLSEFRNNPERLESWFAEIGGAVRNLVPALQAEIDKSHAEGAICHLSASMLLADVISLNAFSVSFADVLCRIYGQTKEAYLASRREENIEVIRKRLMP